MSLQMLEVRASMLMELIVDKLKLLQYETNFCNSRKPPWPRLHKFYFAMPCNNRNDQFLYLVSLVSWLLSLIGRTFPVPKEQADPNTTCMNIMSHLRELGFVQPSWPATKLKQGYGDAVCSVIDSLTDLALEAQGFVFKQPSYNVESCCGEHTNIENVKDDGAKELYVLTNVSELKSNNTTKNSSGSLVLTTDKQAETRDVFTEAKFEAERVALQLRVATASDGKDWRVHLNEAWQLHSEMSETLTSCCTQLERMEEDILFFLEKLECREKFINKQSELLLTDHNSVQARLMELQQKHKQSLDNVRECNKQLASTTEQLNKVKHKLVEKGNKISDVSPLVEMKNGVHNIKVELQEMEVRIGVLEHTLLQNQVNQSITVTNIKLGLDE